MTKKNLAIDLAKSFGYLEEDEVVFLQTVASLLPANPKIVNIGAGAGTSGLASVEERPDATVYTIDISPGGPLGGLEGERNAFANTGLKHPIQILGESHEVAKNWKNGKVDCIFIDDGHRMREVLGDILYWRTHLKKGGYMIIDDYGSPKWPAVKKAVDRLLLNRTDYYVHYFIDSVIAFRKR